MFSHERDMMSDSLGYKSYFATIHVFNERNVESLLRSAFRKTTFRQTSYLCERQTEEPTLKKKKKKKHSNLVTQLFLMRNNHAI